jgi:hypothetical protein
MIATAFSRAVATMIRSAGSGWNSPGSFVLRTAIARSSGASWIPGSASAMSTPLFDGAVELDASLRDERSSVVDR